MAKKRSTSKQSIVKRKIPSHQVLQRAAKVVLSGKCPLSKPTYKKLKRHRTILRKLATMKGKAKSKKAFMTRNRKQIGGFLPLLPLIASAIGSLIPAAVQGFGG